MTEHQCQHILGDGRLCASPRMNNKNYCYYHTRLHETFLLPGNRHYEPPPLTDAHNIQLALTHVFRAQAKGLITYKQAKALLYNIHLAKNNLETMETPPPEKMITTEVETKEGDTDIPVCADGVEGAPSLPSVGKGGDLDIAHTFQPSRKVECDPANPPLCHELALRPFGSPKPPADSTAVFVPISDEESIKISEYRHRFPDDYTWQQHQRRMNLDLALRKTPNPTPDQIAAAIANMEEEETRGVREREQEIRRLRAIKRDQHNRKLLGL